MCRRPFRPHQQAGKAVRAGGKTGKTFRTTSLSRQTKPGGLPGVGLTGLEPVTLRLSSACSNQLSYRPGTEISRRSIKIGGGKGIRTPDIQLAKLALYQLSYAPAVNARSIDHASRGGATEAKTELCVNRQSQSSAAVSFDSEVLNDVTSIRRHRR